MPTPEVPQQGPSQSAEEVPQLEESYLNEALKPLEDARGKNFPNLREAIKRDFAEGKFLSFRDGQKTRWVLGRQDDYVLDFQHLRDTLLTLTNARETLFPISNQEVDGLFLQGTRKGLNQAGRLYMVLTPDYYSENEIHPLLATALKQKGIQGVLKATSNVETWWYQKLNDLNRDLLQKPELVAQTQEAVDALFSTPEEKAKKEEEKALKAIEKEIE